VPNTPADGKIDPGDIILDIAGTNVTQWTHHDALDLIQRCGNALFLAVQK
jgi:C-terminal processing protease CtpA/Prc